MAPHQIFGNQFGKSDMERLGIFLEMPIMQDKYKPLPPNYLKGTNMYPGGRKLKNGTQHGYFESEFKRLFIGEAIRGRGRKPTPQAKPVSTQPFMPPSYPKKHATPGDFHGTFGGKVTAVSPAVRKQPPPKKEPGNFITRNSKKGGPGYKDICIGPYPKALEKLPKPKPPHKEFGKILNGPLILNSHPKPFFTRNPYPYPPNIKPGSPYVKPKPVPVKSVYPGYITPIGPNKLKGGAFFDGYPKAGTRTDKYMTYLEADKLLTKKVKNYAGPFYPQSTGAKTMQTTSIIEHNLKFRLNNRTLNSFEATFVKNLCY